MDPVLDKMIASVVVLRPVMIVEIVDQVESWPTVDVNADGGRDSSFSSHLNL